MVDFCRLFYTPVITNTCNFFYFCSLGPTNRMIIHQCYIKFLILLIFLICFGVSPTFLRFQFSLYSLSPFFSFFFFSLLFDNGKCSRETTHKGGDHALDSS
ncbi:hypothetical protein BDF20DRAFT_389747 [Mycotypha africana]|uniref:uncharacterized protein n=1 Tax=Mycotypha africana TaxID=64632 RepID=UPI002301B3DD|nr:uncharacterized protein BDF20DRAFT_389747 [Mycotypha africana]KAI8984444.1 hypothetical protein BDF20DRAFT_389747 [Mycotypha africana]